MGWWDGGVARADSTPPMTQYDEQPCCPDEAFTSPSPYFHNIAPCSVCKNRMWTMMLYIFLLLTKTCSININFIIYKQIQVTFSHLFPIFICLLLLIIALSCIFNWQYYKRSAAFDFRHLIQKNWGEQQLFFIKAVSFLIQLLVWP